MEVDDEKTKDRSGQTKAALITAGATVVAALIAASIVFFSPTEDAPSKDSEATEVAPKAEGTVGGMPAPSPSTEVMAPPQKDLDNSRGWGPPRSTFTTKKPAPYVVFNSIVDNPAHGDERNFVQCRDKSDKGGWNDELIAHDGSTYECYAWFANNVASNLDNDNPAARMHNARVRIIDQDEFAYNPGIVGFLSANNAITVWDSCNFLAPGRITIDYIPDTARMFTTETPEKGLSLAEHRGEGLAGQEGLLLGESKQDGIIKQKTGYVLFDVKVTLE